LKLEVFLRKKELSETVYSEGIAELMIATDATTQTQIAIFVKTAFPLP